MLYEVITDSNSKRLIFSHSQGLEFGDREWFFTYSGNVPTVEGPQNSRWIIPMMGYLMSFILFYALSLFIKNIKLTKDMIKKEKTA